MKRIRSVVAALAGVGLVATLAACDTGTSAQSQAQSVTNDYQRAAQQAVPYPLDAMKSGGWTERRALGEHLGRENDPNAIRWVTWLTQQGQVIATWPIKGMVFDPNSQMTNSQSVVGSCGSSSSCTTVAAPGDNGTWGPEAGAAAFFTTSNVEVQLPASAIWVESDAPLNITDKPLITYNANTAPSVDHGGLKGIGK